MRSIIILKVRQKRGFLFQRGANKARENLDQTLVHEMFFFVSAYSREGKLKKDPHSMWKISLTNLWS